MAGVETDWFTSGPVSTGGAYQQNRSAFDGALGFFDGVASVAGSIGNTVGEVADIRADWAAGQAAWDDVVLSRDEREQDMLLDLIKVDRGDNVQLYYALAAAALAAVFLMR